jgi:hypothetical protein
VKAIEQRLKKLDTVAKVNLGFRTFTQKWDNPDLFYETSLGNVADYRRCLNGEAALPTVTLAQIDELERAGWQCIKIVYVDNWRDGLPDLSTEG